VLVDVNPWIDDQIVLNGLHLVIVHVQVDLEVVVVTYQEENQQIAVELRQRRQQLFLEQQLTNVVASTDSCHAASNAVDTGILVEVQPQQRLRQQQQQPENQVIDPQITTDVQLPENHVAKHVH
jgi:hypothetical protein